MSKNKQKKVTFKEQVECTVLKENLETERLIDKAREIDPLSDDYVTIQERISHQNEIATETNNLKGKSMTGWEKAEKVVNMAVAVGGLGLVVKETCGGFIRSDGCKTIMRNALGGVGKILKK